MGGPPKDYSILGSLLGSPYLISFRGLSRLLAVGVRVSGCRGQIAGPSFGEYVDVGRPYFEKRPVEEVLVLECPWSC